MYNYISGIQQIGIGVKNAPESLKYYAKLFGMDALIFNDTSEATLMTKYTGSKVYKRNAILSLNMQGGGGFELWQFMNRQPLQPAKEASYGDIGIYAAKIKCTDVMEAYKSFCARKDLKVSSLQINKNGEEYFWIKDLYNNVFNIIRGDYFQLQKNKITGGVIGAVIGVNDMETSIRFYNTFLNITEITSDEIVCYNAFNVSAKQYRKVIFRKPVSEKGAFGKLLGAIEIELVQCLDGTPSAIYKNRFWGDCGFIHLCLDVFNMDSLKENMEKSGYAFSVDSVDSFGMEKSSGRFCYAEDPDGTLIELVETHKVAILKKLGIYLNLKKKGLEKPLPDWMIKMLALSKVK